MSPEHPAATLRRALAAAVEALIVALDVLDNEAVDTGVGDAEGINPDDEPGADHEPSLGWPDRINQDGWKGLGTDDLEDEHDGREPDPYLEPGSDLVDPRDPIDQRELELV